MHVVVSDGTATIAMPDGVMHTVPYEALSDADMVLQARYHLWMRQHQYRRSFVCVRCKAPMESETQANEEAQTWEMLTVCSCRAIYGKTSLSRIRSAMQT